MKRAAEKLKSSRGASLMMALLLFLTCAVVGSAVLTAGTAASGRMSKIAESDQRYYSVNSAANLLIDLFKDPVKITETVEKIEAKDFHSRVQNTYACRFCDMRYFCKCEEC